MALKDTAIHTRKVLPKCKMRRVWDGLDADDRAVLVGWLEAGWGYRSIAEGLRQDNIDIGEMAVDKHMRGSCHCKPEVFPDGGDPVYECNKPRSV